MGYQEVAINVKNDKDIKKLVEKIQEKAQGLGIDIVEPLGIFKSLNDTDYLIKGEIYFIIGGYERHVVKSIASNSVQIEYIYETVRVEGDASEMEFFKNDSIEYVNYDFYSSHPYMFSFENWDKTFGKMQYIR